MPFVIIIIAVFITLPFYLVFPGCLGKEKKSWFYGKNIAHRGLFSADQSVPENSMTAFENAADMGYGIELDVQLTKDGKVVVFHDDTLDRVCGVKGRVNAYTFEELRNFSLYGTDEKIPLFADVLKLVDGRVPMIVELKTTKQRKELCEKTLSLLRAYKGVYCIESFDPFIVKWFRFHAKDIMRGQLTQRPNDFKNDAPAIAAFILGNTLFNFLARPHFIAHRIGKKTPLIHFCEAAGAMKVAWTSHDKTAEKDYDVVIFEHYLPDIKYK